jgi:serine/arginine repetitive matrix protein 2
MKLIKIGRYCGLYVPKIVANCMVGVLHCSVRETHAIAEAQQEKNARLRDAFGISPRFVEGTSLDPERRAQRYPLVRTPSHEREERDTHVSKKKKKRR